MPDWLAFADLVGLLVGPALTTALVLFLVIPAWHGERHLPLRCVHCGSGSAAAAEYCKVANPIPESLLERLSVGWTATTESIPRMGLIFG